MESGNFKYYNYACQRKSYLVSWFYHSFGVFDSMVNYACSFERDSYCVAILVIIVALPIKEYRTYNYYYKQHKATIKSIQDFNYEKYQIVDQHGKILVIKELRHCNKDGSYGNRG